MKYYIAYGSNLNTEQMRFRCPTAEKVVAGELKDYRLEFRGRENSAVATITPAKGYSVPILTWAIKAMDEKSLDRYEGYPFLYRKEDMELEIDGEKVQAMLYIMNEGRELGMPSEYYLETILEGYAEAGFDTAPIMDALEFSEQGMRGEDVDLAF